MALYHEEYAIRLFISSLIAYLSSRWWPGRSFRLHNKWYIYKKKEQKEGRVKDATLQVKDTLRGSYNPQNAISPTLCESPVLMKKFPEGEKIQFIVPHHLNGYFLIFEIWKYPLNTRYHPLKAVTRKKIILRWHAMILEEH